MLNISLGLEPIASSLYRSIYDVEYNLRLVRALVCTQSLSADSKQVPYREPRTPEEASRGRIRDGYLRDLLYAARCHRGLGRRRSQRRRPRRHEPPAAQHRVLRCLRAAAVRARALHFAQTATEAPRPRLPADSDAAADLSGNAALCGGRVRRGAWV